jgi:hypothetical protein
MVLLGAAGAAAAIKLTQQDVDRIEQHTGASVDELSEEELADAMDDLGIQSQELNANDQAALAGEAGAAPVPGAPAAAGTSYIDELERLADLRDRGIISPEDFEAKKKQLLGL